MNTTVFTRPAALLSRLDAAAATLAGKKGVIAARELANRIRAAAAQHGVVSENGKNRTLSAGSSLWNGCNRKAQS